MATFKQVAKGTLARNTIELGLGRARVNPETGKWEAGDGGVVVELDVRPTHVDERIEIKAAARRFAISKGLTDPKEGDEIYDDAVILHTLAIACVDKDSPENDPKPFFEGGFDELHTSKLLLPDHIGYLFEQQQLWQDEISPLIKHQTPGQFMVSVVRAAEGDKSFFVGQRPGMRWDSMRTLAAAYLNLTTPKSPSTSDSSSGTETPSIPPAGAE